MGRSVISYIVIQFELSESGLELARRNYALKHNLRQAQKYVEANTTDLNEGCFNFVCIEGIEDSTCPCIDDGVVYRQFYKFDSATKTYKKCKTPSIYENHIFSLAF